MAAAGLARRIPLHDGHSIPSVGLGVWRAEPGKLKSLIPEAVKIGYRHFDCAADYQNEDEVGEALEIVLNEGIVKREDLFITTKLWNSDHAHVKEACLNSIQKLKVSYLDLYLIHFPIASRHTGIGTTSTKIGEDGILDVDISVPLHVVWREMEKLVEEGFVKSIGISNYDIYLTRDCLAYAKIKPAVNQVETHPYFQRDSLIKFCQRYNILVTAHTPLGGGVANENLFKSESPLNDPLIKELAQKYGKTPAQIILKWGLQRNTAVIPKTNQISRLKENFDLFDFEIHSEDLNKISSIERKARSNNPAEFWGIDLYA